MRKWLKWIGQAIVWHGQILVLILKELRIKNGTETKSSEEPPPPPPPPGHPG